MKYKLLVAATLIGGTLFGTSCIDDFAEINTNPSTISKGDIPYLFTQALIKYEPSDYMYWFYNAKYTGQLTQAFVPTGGFVSNFNEMGVHGGQGGQIIEVLKYAREMDFLMSEMSVEEAAKFKHIRAMLDPMLVYLGLFDTDAFGDMAYTDACKALHSQPIILTPKLEKVSDLYNLWLTQLDEAIKTLSNPIIVNGQTIVQTLPAKQDIVYKGDVSKWLKLANSLKLKIAVRLLSQDKAKAILIAQEVASSPAGLMNGLGDDLIYNKGTQSSDQNQVYHTGNSFSSGAGNKSVVDFMVKNLDPRVRFFYGKNQYNSKVVQAFFDSEVDNPKSLAKLPEYILANVNYEVVGGRKMFKSWKGVGEPWVRYYGLPSDLNASQQAGKFGDYFDSNRWKINVAGNEKVYSPYVLFNEELVRGRVDYTVPTVPGGPVIQDLTDVPWYGMYMSTAEVNLYLAEFKLLGANLPESAESYFQKAVRASVEEYNHIAALNKIPYYGTTYDYDPNEVVIDLKNGEIETLLASDDYKLTGSTADKLEKVYIQEYLHFMYQPSDQFSSVRRSGIPMVNSKLIAWKNLIPNTEIPRRMQVTIPDIADLMYDNLIESYKSQGFTAGLGIDPTLLNKERVWQDISAPNYGEGTKF